MQSFLEFCAGSRVAKAFAKTMYVPERPKSPIEEDSVGEREIIEELYSDYQCGNLCCLSSTNDIKDWKEVHIKKVAYFFCHEDCYNLWLESPHYIGCWSPHKQISELSKSELSKSELSKEKKNCLL